jgi:predicted ribosome quality control (RQC) complex YloA/Tae2 family protein
MSNLLRYDSLLIRYLAAELDRRLRGRRLLGLALDPARRVAVLELEGDALSWHLHPTQGWVAPGRAELSPEPVPLARRSRVAAVRAPADERVLVIELAAAARQAGRPARIVVELLGNQWNLIAVGPDERIVAALWRRRAGGRELRPGQLYDSGPGAGRRGAAEPLTAEEWQALLGGLPPAERARRLIAEVAYTSPINATAILGSAAQLTAPDALAAAYTRYLALVSFPPAAPRLLELAASRQPYPLPLAGVADVPFPTLLTAMAALAGEAAGAPAEAAGAAAIPLELLDRLRTRIRGLARRRERLAAELAAAESGARLHRQQADLLMGQLHLVRKGMTEVQLPDWTGGTVTVALEPALGPSENAARLYEQARKETRAAERVPPLLERVEAERERLRALLERAERGEVEAAEVAAAVPAVEGRAGPGRAAPPLPYRSYRTSGGLEVRVGRSSRGNDDLTFRHSSPNDIWLHARDVAGAHVILRWRDAEANPPARDLAEAAVLASLHSRARTSGMVAVDWTRRKYVRKPRKSGPGQVAIERARTLFVEPDAEVERRLRGGD